jgi:hypothetical protein
MLSGVGLLCSLWVASASFASNLKDVRVGPHGDYTRVVLETDSKASYSLNQTAGVVTIELQASATPKAVTAKSEQLSWVRVEPAGASSIVRIELKGPARVKQMVLTAPHRIVLDVFADASAAPSPPSEPVAKAAPVPAPVPAPAKEPAEASTTAADEEALLQREADAMLGPAPGAASSATPSEDVATTDAEGQAGASAGDEMAALEGASGDPDQATALPAEPEPQRTPIRVVEHQKSIVDWLTEWPVLAGLAVMMLGLFVILRRRRPAPSAAKAKEEERSAASLFAPEPAERNAAPESDARGAEPSSAVFASGDGPAPGAGETTGDSAESPFDFEPPDTEPEKPEPAPAKGAMLSTIGSVTSTSAFETQAPTSTGGLSLPELERRLALLEQRLEEVIDAKDRLERQVSAQTEELRVQRAAIARTQRVLRTVVRPEDEQPSEPVLKS